MLLKWYMLPVNSGLEMILCLSFFSTIVPTGFVFLFDSN